ncbi:MAG: TonB-dependent receptor [Pseudomonadota bacterium]
MKGQFKLLDDRLSFDVGATWLQNNYQASSFLEYQGEVDITRNSGLLPKLGAAFQLTDHIEIFGAFAQNWSGIPEDTFLGSTAAITEDLQGLESTNADLGIRIVGDNYAFSLQGYIIDADGFIGFTPLDPDADPVEIITGNAATKSENLGSQRTEGVEVTGFYDFGAADIYVSYAYQNARHGGTDDPDVALALRQVGVIAGERVRDIPEHSIFARLGWSPTDHLRLEANIDYRGSRVGGHLITPGFCNPFFCFGSDGSGAAASSALGIDQLEAYTTIGLLAQYDIDVFNGVTLQLNVDNLLDENYIASVSGATATLAEFGAISNFSGGDITAQPGSLDRYFIGAPRTITFSIKAAF